MPYTLTVNGRAATVDVPADMPLLWVLRDVLDLKGTKFGCGAALRDTAPELGALQVQDIANHPEQGHVRRDVDGRGTAIHGQCVGHRGLRRLKY